MKELRVLLALFITTEDDSGDTSDDNPPTGESPTGDSGVSPSWMDSLEIPEDGREAYKDLTNEQVIERLTGPVAPDAYEFTLPEGMKDDALDKDSYGAFTEGLGAVAKELGLSQDQANKVAQFATKFQVDLQENAGPNAIEKGKEIFAGELQSWKSEVGATKAQESITNSDKVLAGFSDPGFLKMLDDTGLRNSPEVIRTFAAIGAVIGEDSVPKPQVGVKNAEDERAAKLAALYPSMAEK